MNRSDKILWGEGLFLRPQHFQHQDCYHEHRLAQLGRAMHPYLWGVQKIEIDPDALEVGIFRVTRLHAMLPDGECIHAPENDALPDAIHLDAIDNSGGNANGLVIHVGLPFLRCASPNASAERKASAKAYRFHRTEVPAVDLFTDAIESDLTVLRKSLRLIPDSESREQYVTLPVARLLHLAEHRYALDAAFMPPALSIAASDALRIMIRRLMELFQAKAQALYRHQRESSAHHVEFRAGDAAAYWLLHTVNTAYASLQHYFHHGAFHPERLFQDMLRIAAQLLTCSKAHSLADLPVYDHAAPGPHFHRLESIIRDLMDIVFASRYARLPLVEQKPGFHTGSLEAATLSGKAAYYVGVAADMSPADLVEAVPQRFKIGAVEDVEQMILTAMPGLQLMPAVQVPPAIPVRPGCYYFSIEPHGPLYARMIASGAICIYVPGSFPELKLELFALSL